MVVASIVRITNDTSRSFVVTPAGLTAGSVRVEGKIHEGVLDIAPGFDCSIEGVRVPWDIATMSGLEIHEPCSGRRLRVSVGAAEADPAQDWIKVHDQDWKPLAVDSWLRLGERNVLGIAGASVDVRLVFDSGSALERRVRFELARVEPRQVFLNLYDLSPSFRVPNALLCNRAFQALGAFHAGIEVYGEEWSFGVEGAGLAQQTRRHVEHVYRESLLLGETRLAHGAVRELVRELSRQWRGASYDLLNRNCIHFCGALARRLGVSDLPPWISRLHETGDVVATALIGGRQAEPQDVGASGGTREAATREFSLGPALMASWQHRAPSNSLPSSSLPRGAATRDTDRLDCVQRRTAGQR